MHKNPKAPLKSDKAGANPTRKGPLGPLLRDGSVYFVSSIGPKNTKKSTGKLHWNDFFNRVLAPRTYLAGFLLKNCADPTNQISISIFLDQIRARFDVFLDFPRKKIDPFSSRYRQLLLKPYNHLSEGIILPYRPSIHPTYPSNFDIPKNLPHFLPV